MSDIKLKGVRTHNLKDIAVDFPRDKLIVVTGLSGSGKSSLAFDTLYAEGQRRYVESLSAYARQFLSMMEKPDVDLIEGLSPAIAIEQKSASHNPRSTVGTITEIYDYLRLLYARVGIAHCPIHQQALQAQTIAEMVDAIMQIPEQTAVMILAPVVRQRKGTHQALLQKYQRQGFVRARIDDDMVDLDDMPELKLHQKHTIDIVVDRLKIKPTVRQRLAESLETALQLADGLVLVGFIDDSQDDMLFSASFSCPHCGFSLEALEPRVFSFNSPKGACHACEGLGVAQSFDPKKIIQDPTKSISEGAIKGWGQRQRYYHQLLDCVCEHFNIDMDKPFEKLSKKHQQLILHGSAGEAVRFTYLTVRGNTRERIQPFEGVIPNMMRRYTEADSKKVWQELSQYLSFSKCTECDGERLQAGSRHVRVNDKRLPELCDLSIEHALSFFEELKLEGSRAKIAEKIVKEVRDRLMFLVEVGLGYLSLSRSAETLSGGEAQRIRLASQIGSGLVGVMYILDEPSIGLHQRDNQRLLNTLHQLRDLGNTVIVVEHDADTMLSADCLVDLGPGAGEHGGEIVAIGSPQDVMNHDDSLTGKYLSGSMTVSVDHKRIPFDSDRIVRLEGASLNNLKSVDIDLPLGLMTCVTGVSGSGKSSLINDTLYPLMATELNGASTLAAGAHKSIKGLEHLDKIVAIDQSAIGRTPRSNPATYTGLFTVIRELFAGTQEARSRGYKVGRFSFNVAGGRCEACEGDGVIKVEMHFLADIYVTCDQCKGQRYKRETLTVHYKGQSIFDVLQMTVEQAHDFFENIPAIRRKTETLMAVGLSYITLGQSATTLSGGEAQRVKLSRELSKRSTGKTLYLLDEPTTGLHFHDVSQLLRVLLQLRDRGNTIVIIEHNLDVIKTADWIIDLGPEGGDGGGEIVAVGSPEQVAAVDSSFTGRYLKPLLSEGG